MNERNDRRLKDKEINLVSDKTRKGLTDGMKIRGLGRQMKLIQLEIIQRGRI